MNLSSASLLLGTQILPSTARLLGWPTIHLKATSIAASQLHVSESASNIDWSKSCNWDAFSVQVSLGIAERLTLSQRHKESVYDPSPEFGLDLDADMGSLRVFIPRFK